MANSNKKGFTLIELLAVIIILGVLLLIAIPSISKYIINSRIKTYEANLLKYVEEVSNKVNLSSDKYVFRNDEYLIVPIPCIELENGDSSKSPFGPYIPVNSFVAVTRIYESGTNIPKGFNYYVAALDVSGFGVGLVVPNSNEFKVSSSPEISTIIGPFANDKSYQIAGEIENSFNVEVMNKKGKLLTCDAYKVDSSLLKEQILKDNKVTSDENIDFNKISSDTNGKGLYSTNKNTQNNTTVYYFRGAVYNNYVKLGKDLNGKDILWRIVRINEDGSIRLITENLIGTSIFNNKLYDNAYVGYMYGTPTSDTYGETHANFTDSTIKKILDDWYLNKSNLSNYIDRISNESGFCNDRSIAPSAGLWSYSDTALGYNSNVTVYGATFRMVDQTSGWKVKNARPQFKCPNEINDLFTTSIATNGNKALTYPIGLLTLDEIVYAGAKFNENNTNMYLSNGNSFWMMSPADTISQAREWRVSSSGGVYTQYVDSVDGVRPVINLDSKVEIIRGNGTLKNPYIIK